MKLLPVLALVLLGILGSAAQAAPRSTVSDPPVAVQGAGEDALIVAKNGRMSLDEAVAKVRRRYGGQVIRAETRGNMHYVKLLSKEGRVRTVRVDARTGRIQ